jgi:hypothetical protein
VDTITFGPDRGVRQIRRFALATIPVGLVVAAGAGWQLSRPAAPATYRLVLLLGVVVGAAAALAAIGLVLVERRARAGLVVGPDGIPAGRGRLPWSAVTRVSLHRGAGGRRLMAAWPERSGRPVWLGAADRASVPFAEVLSLVEKWSGRHIDGD